MATFSTGAGYTEIFSAGSAGWTVTQNPGSIATVFNFTANQTGLYSVCYKLRGDEVWTLVYKTLEIQARNPQMLTMTPVSALEGEMFTLEFTQRNATAQPVPFELEMTSVDQVELYFGWIHCLTRRSSAMTATSPVRKDLLPNVSFFQLAANYRGLHTLCYVRIDRATGVRTTSWGFPMIPILPNPDRKSVV